MILPGVATKPCLTSLHMLIAPQPGQNRRVLCFCQICSFAVVDITISCTLLRANLEVLKFDRINHITRCLALNGTFASLDVKDK
jgi:hypothetical protein